MASETVEQRIERACKDHEIPGLIMVAGDSSGQPIYKKAFGNRSLKDGKPDPMPLDAVMWLASCTKLVTTVAVLQCVDKGLLSLDDDITTVLPELKDVQVLTGFEKGEKGEDKPVLKENTKTITLRNMITHTSGLSYDIFSKYNSIFNDKRSKKGTAAKRQTDPVLMRFRATQGITPAIFITAPLPDALTFPLLFQPGESWDYSVGIDWAGWAVERVSKLSLEEYFQKNIWGPLGVSSMTFFPKKHPEILKKVVDMSIREGGVTMFANPKDPNGKVVYSEDPLWNIDMSACSGGAGLYGAPIDYFKLLQSLLVNDEKLLKKSSVDKMFEPQLNEAGINGLKEKLAYPDVNIQMSNHPMGTETNFGLGSGLLMEDLPGRWKEGTLFWSGYPNLHWYIDRKSGIASIMGSQTHGPGDPKFVEFSRLWSEEIFRKAGKGKL
ncbi:related to transesterase [Phialocephala subalpina]|uniref:Related to transesterase n=1 Tax=Phialocephala subalpina TaxID=576137 RepID=A0A1L7WVF8_9HELO|nr:related to transesterase [Phialocephala subalpina]